jgi:hypothetical protein
MSGTFNKEPMWKRGAWKLFYCIKDDGNGVWVMQTQPPANNQWVASDFNKKVRGSFLGKVVCCSYP